MVWQTVYWNKRLKMVPLFYSFDSQYKLIIVLSRETILNRINLIKS